MIPKLLCSLKVTLFAILFVQSSTIQAGGSPETTLIVVNVDSPFSKAVANYYRNLRDIPANHVLYLSDIPSQSTLKIVDFRRKILWPIYQYLVDEKLFDHIDTVAYSADFPYSVDFSADAKRAGLKLNKYTGKAGSLTGMTYFFSQVLQGDLSYLSLYSNGYFRQFPDPRPYQKPSISARDSDLLKQAKRHHRKKRYQQAKNTLEQLITSRPDLESAHYLLAKSLARLQHPEPAMDHLQKAIQLGFSNRLAANNDQDLKLLSKQPLYTELLETIESRPAKLRPTEGFTSTHSWQYIQRISGHGIQLPTTSSTERKKAINSLALKPSVRPKLMLSTMLAYTGIRGNGLEEIYRYLSRSASSDGTQPPGKVYLMTNRDVRTETRYPAFESFVNDMRRINRESEIIAGTLPKAQPEVVGLVTGTRRFNWPKSKSTLVPGAIAESLTSYGGHFNNSSQTKLTEFLRQGAAGSSGAVREPYSIAEKFPSPYLHYHYALGSSLAEAFYQSIASPYQLLIVGDPLTRPFVRFAEIIVVENLEQPLKGMTIITPMSITPFLNVKIFELWVDGNLHASTQPGGQFILNTEAFSDGQHELRVVAIENSPLKTRTYKKWKATIDNRDQQIINDGKPISVRLGEDIVLHGRVQGPHSSIKEITLSQGTRHLATIPVNDDHWSYRMPSAKLGLGLTEIQLHSFQSDFLASSQTYTIEVKPPPEIAPTQANFKGNPGFIATVIDKYGSKRTYIQKALNGGKNKVITNNDRTISYNGTLKIKNPGLYQLKIFGNSNYRIHIGNKQLYTERKLNKDIATPLTLKKGCYEFELLQYSQIEKVPKLHLSGPHGEIIFTDKWVEH